MTDPDWVPIMKRAAGIVTDHGGPTSHAAIVSRELGVPAVVGTGNATAVLAEGRAVTISCAEGDEGRVYEGSLAFDDRGGGPRGAAGDAHQSHGQHRQPRSRLPVVAAARRRRRARPDGIHHQQPDPGPPDGAGPPGTGHRRRRTPSRSVPSPAATRTRRNTSWTPWPSASPRSPRRTIPRPVIVRLSDFKTNEYAHLIGGSAFEEPEENPMLGFRGASRYYDERYREGFALECRGPQTGAGEARLRQHHRDDPVLPDPAGSGPGAGRDGGERPGPGRERPAGLHDVRDPVQRRPRREVRHPLRRLLHRLQ